MMNILITGFEPFGEDPVNPSFEAVRRLPPQIGPAALHLLQLPVVFGTGAEILLQKVRSLSPDAVICTGLAGGRKQVTPELCAVNEKTARLPDNEGNQPIREAIITGGPHKLYSTLPVETMASAMNAKGIPAALSENAGTYVCNEVLYRLLTFREHFAPGMKAGFIHVPYASEYVPEGKDVFSLPLITITEALEICIATYMKEITERDKDIEK